MIKIKYNFYRKGDEFSSPFFCISILIPSSFQTIGFLSRDAQIKMFEQDDRIKRLTGLVASKIGQHYHTVGRDAQFKMFEQDDRIKRFTGLAG